MDVTDYILSLPPPSLSQSYAIKCKTDGWQPEKLEVEQ